MRTAVAIILGTAVGALVVIAAEWVGEVVFPPPEGADLSDPQQLAAVVETLPLAALIAVVVAWFLGSLAGGAVAGRIARGAWQPASVTVGAFLLFFGGITLLQFAHPLWMWLVGVILPLPTAWFGGLMTHNLVPQDGPSGRQRPGTRRQR